MESGALSALLAEKSELQHQAAELERQLAVTEGRRPPSPDESPSQCSAEPTLDALLEETRALQRHVAVLKYQRQLAVGHLRRGPLWRRPMSCPHQRTCFDILDDELVTRIALCLPSKDAVRFAATCKRFAALDKRSGELRYFELLSFFSPSPVAGTPDAPSGKADTVAWLTSNKDHVHFACIDVSGAPVGVIETLFEAPHVKLVFPSKLFTDLEQRLAQCTGSLLTAFRTYCVAHARLVDGDYPDDRSDISDPRGEDEELVEEAEQRIQDHGFSFDYRFTHHEQIIVYEHEDEYEKQIPTGASGQLAVALGFEFQSGSRVRNECCVVVAIVSRRKRGFELFRTHAVNVRPDNFWLVAAELYLAIAAFEYRQWEWGWDESENDFCSESDEEGECTDSDNFSFASSPAEDEKPYKEDLRLADPGGFKSPSVLSDAELPEEGGPEEVEECTSVLARLTLAMVMGTRRRVPSWTSGTNRLMSV